MAKDTRARMVAGAARMIARRGVDAMSLRELADSEGVPLGSTYHFFPGGKAALVDDAVNYVGDEVCRVVESTRGQGPEAIVGWVLDAWRRILIRSDFRSGCPVLAAAVAKDERHRATARAVFDRWTVPLGRPGNWLRRPAGRTLLGWMGCLMAAAAGALVLSDWMGWTW